MPTDSLSGPEREKPKPSKRVRAGQPAPFSQAYTSESDVPNKQACRRKDSSAASLVGTSGQEPEGYTSGYVHSGDSDTTVGTVVASRAVDKIPCLEDDTDASNPPETPETPVTAPVLSTSTGGGTSGSSWDQTLASVQEIWSQSH